MNMIPLFVIVPLGAAFLLPILARFLKGLPDWWGSLTCAFLAGLTICMLPAAKEQLVYYVGGWKPAAGIPIGIHMVLDSLSVLMLLIINGIAFLVSLYSVSYMGRYTDKGKYYTLFLLMVAGLNGVVLAGDLFNLFVFLEITAIASYALVAFGVEAEELEASFKYQVLGGLASVLILLGIALFYNITKTLNLADAGQVLNAMDATPGVLFVSCLFLAGFSLKAALIPFHAWLPDAHPSAPAPISAMLSGVVIKVLGVYVLMRLFLNVFGDITAPFISTVFLVLGTISMVMGAYLALVQSDYKRLLAYSSISQIGFVIFALGLGTEMGYLGALFHLINHAGLKSLLFMNAGSVVYGTESRDMEKLGGLYHKMPITGNTVVAGSLSISGLPPFGGFWSKLIIILAAVQAGYFLLALIAVLTSIVTLTYYLKSLRMVFFGPQTSIFSGLKESPVFMCIPMIILAIISIGLGVLLIPDIKELFLGPAVDVLKGGLETYVQLTPGG